MRFRAPLPFTAVSHRREQKEALRREREERERQKRDAERRKKLLAYGVGGALAVAALAVVILLAAGGGSDEAAADVFPDGGSAPEQRTFDLAPAARAAGCELESKRAPEDVSHTTSLDERIRYDTNPPSVGRQYEVPAEDGLYGTAPQDEELVHALEHGRVIFWAKPGLPQEQREQLRALYEEDDYQLLLVPRKNMPYAVAASAWNAEPGPTGTGRILGCSEVTAETIDALRVFRDEHRSRGPEPVP